MRLRFLIPILLLVCAAAGGAVTAHASSDRQRTFAGAAAQLRAEWDRDQASGVPASSLAPLRSALTVGLSYFAGATVPVLGYFFVPPREGLVVSVIATVTTLFVVGAAKTIITARPWWRSGLESMATGIVAAAVTYGAGRFFARR